MIMIVIRLLTILCFVFILLSSCNDNTPKDNVDQIVIGVQVEPTTLNPILATNSSDREIYQYLFSRLADQDYETLELKPVLLKELPTTIESSDGKGVIYEMEIKESATWDNGSPITANDVVTTFKMASHPGVNSPIWKLLLEEVTKIEIDSENDKKFKLHFKSTNFQSLEYILSAYIYPSHVYDANNLLSKYDYEEIKDPERSEELMKDSTFVNFGREFSSIEFSKNTVVGSGPYSLENWITGQYLVLNKKESYWGSNYPETDQLESISNKLVYQFFPDLTTAVTTIKNDGLDILELSRMPYTQFDDLQENENFNKKYSFHTPKIPRYLQLILNNDDERLSDKSVRKALRYLTNVDRLVNQLEGGYGQRINSPVDINSPQYNSNLKFSEYSIEKAKELLDNSNWVDSDGNGIRDKIVNGIKEELSLRFHITGSDVSRSMSGIIREACEIAGIDIQIVVKPFGATRTENINTGDYEMTIMVITLAPVRRDLYPSFHSSSIGSGGSNFYRYNNPEADRLIELIRDTKDESLRQDAYLKVQEIIDEDAPVIFLYSPQLRIVSDNQIDHAISTKRPGYFVNAIAD